MATVNKDFRIKSGLIVEGASATVNGENILTTGSSTDNLPEGSVNLYFTSQRAVEAVSSEINTAVSTAINALTTSDIEEGSNLYFTTERAVTANEGLWDTAGAADTVAGDLTTHINDTSAHGVTGDVVGTSDSQSLSNKTFKGATYFQSAGGAGGSNNHIDVDGTTGKLVIESGYAVDVTSSGSVKIHSGNANVILDGDTGAYIGSASAGNEIATRSTIDNLIGDNTVNGSTGNTVTDRIAAAINGLAPNYITSVGSNLDVTGGELTLGSDVVIKSGGLIEIRQVDATDKLTAPDFRVGNAGKVFDNNGDLDVQGYGNVIVDANDGNIVLSATGSSYVGSVASGNEIATQSYVDSAVSNKTEIDDNVTSTTATWSSNKINSEIDTAVSNVVGLAPEALNTLEELAAAFSNSPDTLSNLITTVGGKQDALTAGDGIDLTGATISVRTENGGGIENHFAELRINRTTVDAWYDASGAAGTAETNANTYTDNAIDTAISSLSTVYDSYGAASTAETNANTYTDSAISGLSTVYDAYGAASTAQTNANGYTDTAISGLSSVYDALGAASTAETNANGYTDGYVGSVLAGNEAFTAVNINSVASQVAATQTVASASTVTGLSWAKADFKSAKLMVKAANSTNSQVSEVLVTLDSSNNVAVTEFAIVYTDTELATVTADVSGTDVRLRVTTLGSATTVTVVGTLLV
jgi:hypothetical protein